MKKIVMRAHSSPLANNSMATTLAYNSIGDNAGNMLFQSSVMRALMTEGVTVDTVKTVVMLSDEEIDRINSEYDCFVIPLANAIRISFLQELRIITEIVKRLTIPCIVVGIGTQSDHNGNATVAGKHDRDVEAFIDAVLDKSECIGVRGEFTADYFRSRGYIEGKDFVVIGCPAMFMFGDRLPEPRVKDITPESIVTVNRKLELPEKLHADINRFQNSFDSHYFVPQNYSDYYLLYFGRRMLKEKEDKNYSDYPIRGSSRDFKQDVVKAFLNVPTWIDFMKKSDFNFGSRIHGNIAGLLGGAPTFIFASDGRVSELAEYHGIPYMISGDINESTDIFKIYEKADFNKISYAHKEHFEVFREFLNRNGLPTIYDSPDMKSEYDRIVRSTRFHQPVRSYASLGRLGKKYRRYRRKQIDKIRVRRKAEKNKKLAEM